MILLILTDSYLQSNDLSDSLVTVSLHLEKQNERFPVWQVKFDP